MDLVGTIKLAKDIYSVIQLSGSFSFRSHRLGDPNHSISPNALAFLIKFQKGYEDKNIEQMNKLISDSYTSSSLEYENKEQLINGFKELFESCPNFCNLKLLLKIDSVLTDSQHSFTAAIEFDAQVSILGLPVHSFDAGDLYFELSAEPPYGLFKIIGLEIL